MLILLIVIGIIMIIIDVCFTGSRNDRPLAFCGGFIGIVAIIALLSVSGVLINTRTIDSKLEMYESENNRIQQEVSVMVEGYMDYESLVLKDIKVESPVVLIGLFPELKANELVNRQVDIYISNNQIIRDLQIKKIDASNYKWWIYFGG